MYLRIAETAALPRLLFLHIPKTGGIALYTALEAVYGREQSTRFANPGEGVAAAPEHLRRHLLVSGHEQFADMLAKGLGDYFTVTVVREPVARLISVYHYVRSLPDHPLHAEYIGMQPEDWVVKIETRKERNRQIWQLGGSPWLDAARPMLDRIDLLIPYDELEEGARRLSAVVGAPLALNRLNETDKTGVATFTESQRARIGAATSGEFGLLAYVRGRWAGRP